MAATKRRGPFADPPYDDGPLPQPTLPEMRERFPAASDATLRLLYMAFGDATRRRERDVVALNGEREELAHGVRQLGLDFIKAANELSSGNPGLGRLTAARLLAESALRTFARAEALAAFQGKHDLIDTAMVVLSNICRASAAKEHAASPAQAASVEPIESANTETPNAGEERAKGPS